MEMGILMAVIIGLVGLALIGGGLMVLNSWLKEKSTARMMHMMNEKMLPEIEQMTYRMIENGTKKMIDVAVEMTKKKTTETSL